VIRTLLSFLLVFGIGVVEAVEILQTCQEVRNKGMSKEHCETYSPYQQ